MATSAGPAMSRPGAAKPLLLAIWAVTACSMLQLGWCQLQWPIQGQGVPPANVTGVTVDVIVETLRSINSEANSFNGVHWLHLTWNDSRAAGAIQDATQRWVNGSSGCSMPCDTSKQSGAGCCDGVWLPHIDATNMVALSQEAIYRYRVWVDPVTRTVTNPDNTTSTVTAGGQTVHWVTRLTAEWQSPFDFRAWPFEHQHLLVELQVTPSLADRVYLVMGQALFVTNTPHTKGDEVPGWYVSKVTRKLFNSSACWDAATNSMGTTTSVYSVSDDAQSVSLKPLNAASWASLRYVNTSNIGTISNIVSSQCNPKVNTEATAQYGPQILVVDIMIRRTQLYYILSTVLPLLLLDYMVFITYAMERSDLEARMGVVVTLVLAVSALQFTWNFPPSSYLNAVQQITLCSYCLYFVVAVQSMITSHISRLHARKRSWQQLFNTAHGNALAQAPSGPLGSIGTFTRTNSSAIGLIAAPTSSTLGDALDGSKGGRTSAFNASNRGLRKQASSMAANPREGSGQLALGPQQQQHDTITEESAHDITAGGAVAGGDASHAPPRSTSDGSQATAAGAHVELEVVELGQHRISKPGGGSAGGARGSSNGGTRRSIEAPYYQAAGPLAEASELSSADEQPCPAVQANGEAGLRHRSGARSSRRFGKCLPQCGGGEGDSTQDEGIVSPPAPGEGPVKPRRRSSLDALPHALSRAGSTVASKTREVRGRIDADEAYAQLFAARMDQVFSWTLLVCFTVVVAVLLYVNQQVGDHKLMLTGDPPANM